MRHVKREGRYCRVADPDWPDPLSPDQARRIGGRWNAPGAFGIVYLNASRSVARAQVRQKLEPRGIRPEDLDPAAGPVLIHAEVPADTYVDAVTEGGLESLGLPTTYPLDADGKVIPHSACQPIGRRAWKADEAGIACRSAAPSAPHDGEELAYFAHRPLEALGTTRFADWFWADP